MVKHLYKYELLQETIETIFKDLNLSGDPTLTKAKSNLRTDRRNTEIFLIQAKKPQSEKSFPKRLN